MVKYILDNGLALSLLGISLILLFFGFRWKKVMLKQLAFNLAAIFFAFLLYELYLDYTRQGKKKEIKIDGKVASNYVDYHPTLGYAARDDEMQVELNCRLGEKQLYEANYQFRDGWRAVPEDTVPDTAWAAFMGGSFTFGEGLNDEETLPAQFNRATGGYFKTLNFGFHGYGPHHALRLMDIAEATGKLDTTHHCRLAFYLFIPDHVRRAAGYASWDFNGPKYEIRTASLVNSGQFSGPADKVSGDHKLTRALRDMWQRSDIAHTHFRKEQIDIDREDIALTVAIFEALKEKWKDHHTQFIILLDQSVDDWTWRAEFEKALREKSVESISLSKIFTDEQEGLYIEGDGHPTALYNALLAEYLSKQQVPYLCQQQVIGSWKH